MRTINPVSANSIETLRVVANPTRARRQELLAEEPPKAEDTLDLAGVFRSDRFPRVCRKLEGYRQVLHQGR